MTLMREPGDPWYIGITTLWFLVASFVFYPASLLASMINQPAYGIVHWLLMVVWAGVLSYVCWKLASRFVRGSSGE